MVPSKTVQIVIYRYHLTIQPAATDPLYITRDNRTYHVNADVIEQITFSIT